MAATTQAFDIRAESIFNRMSQEGRTTVLSSNACQGDVFYRRAELQKLAISPISSSSCLSCQVGLAQHVNHRDLLKVDSLCKIRIDLESTSTVRI